MDYHNMPKPEGLMELVERLDRMYQRDGGIHHHEWPRLRDAIVAYDELREAVTELVECPYQDDHLASEVHFNSIKVALARIARLDNPTPKEPGE